MCTGHRRRVLLTALAALATMAVLGGCSHGHTHSATSSSGASATASEANPAGDIPDTQVYVPFTSPDGVFTVSVPEGWARSADGNATVFTDKTNSVRLESVPQPSAPTLDSVKTQELPAIAAATSGYQPGAVSVVQRKAGPGVLATYWVTSAPNPVTGKTVTDAVERYEFWHAGHTAIITLSGPVGADNVDPWMTITNSPQWR
jgi:hypothetical protein